MQDLAHFRTPASARKRERVQGRRVRFIPLSRERRSVARVFNWRACMRWSIIDFRGERGGRCVTNCGRCERMEKTWRFEVARKMSGG